MSGATTGQMADRIAELMEARLGVRGATLAEKLRRGGRLLPRRIRRAAEYMARCADQARSPRLQLQLDHEKIADAYDACVRYLKPLGAGARRRAILLDMLTGIIAAVVVTLALVVTVLAWRGYL